MNNILPAAAVATAAAGKQVKVTTLNLSCGDMFETVHAMLFLLKFHA